MYRQIAEGSERLLGKEHEHTLWSASDLAWVLTDQMKYEEAEAIHRKTLKSRQRVLGREHEQTLNSASALGYVIAQ
jgi:hypothetical protein